MDFDERVIEHKHVDAAIERYCRERPKHHPARSAFVVSNGEKLPAKQILRMAFEIATEVWPRSETLTGGKASVRVLKKLGFDAVYEKRKTKSWNKSPVKSARRAAFKKVLEEKFGRVEMEWKSSSITVPDLEERRNMQADLRRILDAIESHRNQKIRGRKGHKLAFDLFIADLDLPIEFDERQHFTPLRAVSLCNYSPRLLLGFDSKRWMELSEKIRAGDNSPAYRDEQRAFYDSIRDILVSEVGLLPVVRIFEEDVEWEKTGETTELAQEILTEIEALISQKRK